jgi:hypothetical protein
VTATAAPVARDGTASSPLPATALAAPAGTAIAGAAASGSGGTAAAGGLLAVLALLGALAAPGLARRISSAGLTIRPALLALSVERPG